jgi:hypothetical protein
MWQPESSSITGIVTNELRCVVPEASNGVYHVASVNQMKARLTPLLLMAMLDQCQHSILLPLALQELAWSSFALLKNTNSCTLLVLDSKGNAVMTRGATGTQAASQGSADAVLAAITKVGKGAHSTIQLCLDGELPDARVPHGPNLFNAVCS